jgi:hypothetical protein
MPVAASARASYNMLPIRGGLQMRSLTICVVIMAVLLAGFATGCKTLAMSGKEKYKVDMNNIFLSIRDEVTNQGTASEKNVKKLEELLTKYRPEFGPMGSFIQAETVLSELKLAVSEPDKQFLHNQKALMAAGQSQEFLKTEIDNAS